MAMKNKLINVGNGKKRQAKCLIKIIDDFIKALILVYFFRMKLSY